MKRTDGRSSKQLRSVKMTKDFVIYPEGSVLLKWVIPVFYAMRLLRKKYQDF